jgi:hypothetical protein
MPSTALGKRKVQADTAESIIPEPVRESTAPGKRKAALDHSSDVDDDVQVKDAASEQNDNKNNECGDDEDEDVQFISRTGDIALADFPHCREK